jgi:hypothetical protein
MDEFDDILQDFIATTTAKPNLSNEELLQKFPEFKGDEALLQSAYDYKATVASGKYSDATQLKSKFPEFFTAEVKKKDETQVLPQPQPQNTTSVSEDTVSDISQPQTTPTSGLEGQEPNRFTPIEAKEQPSGVPSIENIENIPELTDLQKQGAAIKPIKDIFESASKEDLELLSQFEELGNLTEEETKEIDDKILAEKSGNFGFLKTAQNVLRTSPQLGIFPNPLFDPSQMAKVTDKNEATKTKVEEKQQEFISNLDESKQEKLKTLVSVKGFREDSTFEKTSGKVKEINNSLTNLDSDFTSLIQERQKIEDRVKEITAQVKETGATNALRDEYDALLEKDKTLVEQGKSIVDNANNLEVEREDALNESENSLKNIGTLEQELDMLKRNYGFLDNISDRINIGFAEVAANAKSGIERNEVKRQRGTLKAILSQNQQDGKMFIDDVPAKYKVDSYKYNEAEFDKETDQLINRSLNSAFNDRNFAEKARESLRPKTAVEDINSFSDVVSFTIDGLAENVSTLTQLAIPYVGQTMFVLSQKEGNEVQLRKERLDNQKSLTDITKALDAEGISDEKTEELTKEKESLVNTLYTQNGLTDAHYRWASTGMAVSELVFSRMFGEVKRLKVGKRILSDAGKNTLKSEVKKNTLDQIRNTSKNVFKGSTAVAKDAAEEGFLDEFLTNTTQNGIKMFALDDKSVHLFDNSIESIAGGLSVGTVMSVAPRVAGQFINHYSDKARRNKVYKNVVQVTSFQKYLDDNPSLNEQEKQRIEQKMDALLLDNKNIIRESAQSFDNLTTEQKEKLLDLSTAQTALEISVEKLNAKKELSQQEYQLRSGFTEEIEILDAEKKALLDSASKEAVTETETTTPKAEIKEVSKQTTDFVNELAEKKEDIEDVSEFVGGQLKVTIGDSSIGINSKGDNIVIESISTKEGQRGQGSAKKALTKVTDLADAQGKTIELNVVPLDETTTADGLIKLYEEAGFVKVEGFEKDGGKMVREPKKETTQTAPIETVEDEVSPTIDLDPKDTRVKEDIEKRRKQEFENHNELSGYLSKKGELEERIEGEKKNVAYGKEPGNEAYLERAEKSLAYLEKAKKERDAINAKYDAELKKLEEVVKPTESKPNQTTKPTDSKESAKKEDAVEITDTNETPPNSNPTPNADVRPIVKPSVSKGKDNAVQPSPESGTSKGEVKGETKLVKSKKGEFYVTFNENGDVTKIVSKKTGKEVPKFVERKVRPSKKNPQGKIASVNGNYTTIEADALGVLTDNKAKEERKAKLAKALDQYNPSDEYGHALIHMARGGKVSLESAKSETKLSTKEVRWAVGFGDPTELKSLQGVAEDIIADAIKDDLKLSKVRKALIEIISENESVSQLEDAIIEEYETLQNNQNKEEARAHMNRLSDKDFTFINGIIKEDEYLSELSNEEKAEYYEQTFEKPEELNRQPSGSTTSTQESDGKKSQSIFNQDNVKEKLDFLDSLKLDPNNLSSTLPFAPQAWNAFIEALKIAVKAGNTIQQAVKIAIRKLQSNGYKADELKKIANHFAKQTGVEVDLNDIKDSKADFKKKVGKKSVLSRAATGEGNQKIKDALKKHGLDFQVENQEEAKERAEAFVKDVGLEGAIDAIKSGVITEGAELAFIYAEVLDILETQNENTTGKDKLKAESDYARLQEDIFTALDAKARGFGRFLSALNKVYNSSYFRYNLAKQIVAWEARNNRKIDAETLAKFEERDAKIKEYEKQLVELRKRLEDAEAQQAVDDIKDSIDREKDRKKKKPRRKLSEKDQTRKKELFNKYFAFNDATRMLTLLAEADFREYLGLVLKEAGNDLANFSNDIAEQWGETSRKIMPKLFKAAQNQLKTDKELAKDKKRNTLVKKLENDIKSLDEQIKKGERKVIEKKEDQFANDKEIQKLRDTRSQKQEQLSEIVKENQEYDVFIDEEGNIKIPPQLIRDLVESGITDIDELSQVILDEYLADEDVTLREVRDAVTGYGKTVNPSKDEISEQISLMKNLGRILSGTEDVMRGERPLRSGFQRRKKLDVERREERKLKELMRDLPLDDTESEQKWKTQLDAIKSRLKNQLSDIQDQIDNRERRKPERTPIEYDQEAKDLVEQRNELRDRLDALVGKPELSNEDRVKIAENGLERSIENLETDIKGNKLAFKTKNTVTSDRITELRKRQAELRAELNEMREASGLIEARRLANRKKAVTKRLAELQEKRKNKDYSKKEHKAPAVDAELNEIQQKYNREKEKYDTEAYADELKNQHWATKLSLRVLNFLGLQRLLLATGEFSPMFLQNGVPVVNLLLRAPIQIIKGKPVKLFNMISNTVKSYSQKEFDKDYAKMEADEDYDLIVKMKVALTRTDFKAAAQEETFQSDVISSAFKFLGESMDWDGKARHTLLNTVKKKLGIDVSKKDKFSIAEQVQKKDPFKTLERFTTTFGNEMKMDLAKKGIRKLEAEGKNPIDHKEDYLRLGKAVNTLTGRASMNFKAFGKEFNLETNSQVWNALFFSARFATSTFNKINPYWYAVVLRDSESTFRNPKVSVAQKLALSQAITYIITTASFVFALQALGGEDEEGEKIVEIEKDPRSSDFMKVKIGNIRFDPWGGHLPWVTLIARMKTGQMKRTNGQVIELGEGRNANKFDKFVDFGVGKANPTLATIIRFARANEEIDGVKRDQWGNEVSIEEELKMMYPIYWQGLREVMAENPEKAKALTYSLVGLGLLGINNQVYGTSDKALFKSFAKGAKDELNTKRGQFLRPNKKEMTSDAELEETFQAFKKKHEENYAELNKRINSHLKIETPTEVGNILSDAGFSKESLVYLNQGKPPKMPLFTETIVENKLKTIEDRLQNKDKEQFPIIVADMWNKANFFNTKAKEYNASLDK